VSTPGQQLTVALTGPTGTFGSGLRPLLEASERIGRVIGIGRRPYDAAADGWTKMDYRQGDVRDGPALIAACAGADIVVHLAFLVTGDAPRNTLQSVNIEGTRNAFAAAVAARARRFVYASSVAAYGFHRDNPIGMGENWPVRPAKTLFYAKQKAELERLLEREHAEHPGLELYLLRPSFVVGPHTLGGKSLLGAAAPSGLPTLRAPDVLTRALRRVPVPVPAPEHPLQLVHESDVGQALLRCILATGPPGAYNIAGDGTLTVADLVRETGLRPIRLPAVPTQRAARVLARLARPRFVPPVLQWIEAGAQPAIMDTTKAKAELGWLPRYSGIAALRDALGR
jgi:nucleoside-diphosphate-sugar epimerase